MLNVDVNCFQNSLLEKKDSELTETKTILTNTKKSVDDIKVKLEQREQETETVIFYVQLLLIWSLEPLLKS